MQLNNWISVSDCNVFSFYDAFTHFSFRYGFNSDGHDRVLERLQKLKKSDSVVLGVNLGKNKNTEEKQAHEDYVKGIEKFACVADYFVVNISSPNTVGLRNLQQADNLKVLLSKVVEARNKLDPSNHVPILVKVAPDLSDSDVKDIISVISKKECRVEGLIISNTTIQRDESLKCPEKNESGGLSGAPLKDRSTALVAKIYELTRGQIPIVGVGGISSGQDAYDKITAGASAVQIYTSLIYHGPPIVQKVKNELADILEANGFESVEKARGTQSKLFAKDAK